MKLQRIFGTPMKFQRTPFSATLVWDKRRPDWDSYRG